MRQAQPVLPDLLLTHSIGFTAHFTQFARLEAVTGPQDMVNVMVTEYHRHGDGINGACKPDS